MVDKETDVQTKLHSFLKQRNNKTSVAMQEAQRLVNLYRVLNEFGPDFVTQYNQMLLASSDEVQMSMKALVGGHEVRQYLEFLQSEGQKTEEDETVAAPQQVGWLPSPEEDEKINDKDGLDHPSGWDWDRFKQEQSEKMAQMMDELRREQNEALTRLMNQLSSSLQVQKRSSESVPSPKLQTEYSEIIEEKDNDRS